MSRRLWGLAFVFAASSGHHLGCGSEARVEPGAAGSSGATAGEASAAGGSGGSVSGTAGMGASGGSGGIGDSSAGSAGASGNDSGNAGSGGSAGAGGNDSGSAGSATGGSGGSPSDAGPERVDPGSGPWVPVPPDQVRSVCKLDPAKLAEADQKLGVPWAIVRYGRLCHGFRTEGVAPEEAWSTTKTLGALVTGVVAYQTRSLPANGPKTGAFSDEDRVDRWFDAPPYNREARVAHVLAMVAHNADLSLGKKTMAYDIVGATQINSMSLMLNAAIAQDTQRFGANLEEFTQRFVFAPLGMRQSSWSGGAAEKTFAFTWSTTVLDMARVGLLLLNRGEWNGQRLLSEDWVYRMTHPAFEDANTGYGYLTWLNAASNHHFGGIPGAAVGVQQAPMSPGPCAPVAVYREHPHGLSTSPDCNYSAPHSCSQDFDVGVWQAVGLGGQVIQGHPGLDLVITVKNLTPLDTGPTAPKVLWDAVSPAVIAADPRFAADTSGFCAAYGANRYAPDLR